MSLFVAAYELRQDATVDEVASFNAALGATGRAELAFMDSLEPWNGRGQGGRVGVYVLAGETTAEVIKDRLLAERAIRFVLVADVGSQVTGRLRVNVLDLVAEHAPISGARRST